MRSKNMFIWFAACVFAAACMSSAAFGQELSPDAQPQARPASARAALVRELNLTDDQVARLKEINAQRKPVFQAAQKRYRDALKALDTAIYADVFDEYAYNSRLAEMQKAQCELQRLRFENELNIRRVLTPEQLAKFRDLRAKFQAAKEMRVRRAAERPGRPGLRRLERKAARPAPTNTARPAKVQ